MMEIILKNLAKCNTCGDTLESTHLHDFKYCSCGEETPTCIAVDGGRYYIKRLWGQSADWEELSETRDISHLEDGEKDLKTHFKDKYPSIDCGLGWLELIINCHKELKKIDPDYTVLQIKEKFGGLRYYFDTQLGNEVMELMAEIVSKYEKRASETCEITGLDGKLFKTKDGWFLTRNEQYAPEGSTPARVVTIDAPK